MKGRGPGRERAQEAKAGWERVQEAKVGWVGWEDQVAKGSSPAKRGEAGRDKRSDGSKVAAGPRLGRRERSGATFWQPTWWQAL